MHVRKRRKGCEHSRILKQDKKKKQQQAQRFLRGNPNREKTTGGNNGAKIHYGRSEHKTISKVNQKRTIQKKDKDVKPAIKSKK